MSRFVPGACILALCLAAQPAAARPAAPSAFCASYPAAPQCVGGFPSCDLCHESTTSPPKMNGYGADLSMAQQQYVSGPLDEQAFADTLPSALVDVEMLDSDGDGSDNLQEIDAGTEPGDEASFPEPVACPESTDELDYLICEYDHAYTYRRIGIDFCGAPPTFEQVSAFRIMTKEDQRLALHQLLSLCLDTQFWQGINGVLWQIAHDKIRPLLSFFTEDRNFFDDYAYYTYTQIDGADVRDLLVGQYHVQLIVEPGVDEDGYEIDVVRYQPVDSLPMQALQRDRRAGMLTHAWPLFYNTMFTALPRTTAAQAYRSFLGLDIARSEGLEWAVQNEPIDYDVSGVGAAECAVCHSTLDPLSYPFATYNGLQADGQIGLFEYEPDRIEKYFADQYPAMVDMPESGYIFGQPVQNLLEWAQVAANSDQFFVAVTKDYWRVLMGDEPRAENAEAYAEFTALWEGLRTHHSVEEMLHRFIDTEAYGAP